MFVDMLLEPAASQYHVERGRRADGLHNPRSTGVFLHVSRSGDAALFVEPARALAGAVQITSQFLILVMVLMFDSLF